MSANDWDDEYCRDADDFDGCEHGVGFDEECEACEDDPLGCCFPGKCLMPGIHLESECHTVEMMEEIMPRLRVNQGRIADDNSVLLTAIAAAITSRLKEEIVSDIKPKPTVAQLEQLMEDSEKNGVPMPDLLPSGELMFTSKKPVFASDLADAALTAIRGAGFQIVHRKRTVLDATQMTRPGDEPLA